MKTKSKLLIILFYGSILAIFEYAWFSSGPISDELEHQSVGENSAPLPWDIMIKGVLKERIARQVEDGLSSQVGPTTTQVSTVNSTLNNTCSNSSSEYYGDSTKESRMQYFRRRKDVVNTEIDIVTKPNELCQKSPLFGVIIVQVNPDEVEKRATIRQTWGGVGLDNCIWPDCSILEQFELAFILGLHNNQEVVLGKTTNANLLKEIKDFDDIIIGRFVDHYQNLYLKSTLVLRVMAEFCSRAQYLIKADTDVFANLPALGERLLQTQPKRSMLGNLRTCQQPNRYGKWKITEKEYPFPIYPEYLLGGSYIITSDLFAELYQASRRIPYIWLEDVYVTGILAEQLGADVVQFEGIAGSDTTVCDVIKKKLTLIWPINTATMKWFGANIGNLEICEK